MSDYNNRRAIAASIRVGLIVSMMPLIGFAETTSSSDSQAITAGGARAITAWEPGASSGCRFRGFR